MPHANTRAFRRRGIPKVVTSPLDGDDIILVVQANSSAPAQVSEISMIENVTQGRWYFQSKVPEMTTGSWLVVDQ
jgi:hypothetical protein